MTTDPRAFLGRILAGLGLPWCEDVLNLQPGHVIGGDHNTKHRGQTTFVRPTYGEREERLLPAFLSWRSSKRAKSRV